MQAVLVFALLLFCGQQLETEAIPEQQLEAKTTPDSKAIPPGSKIYIEPMSGNEIALAAAFVKKKVPLEMVAEEQNADFKLTGLLLSKKAGAVTKIIAVGLVSTEYKTSFQIANRKTGTLVFACSREEPIACQKCQLEYCAKELRKHIEQQQRPEWKKEQAGWRKR